MTRATEVQRRLAIPRIVARQQSASIRKRTWDETYVPPDLASARTEAMRCIQCPAAPCQQACPLHNDIPAALKLLEAGDVIGAAEKFRETSNLPELCGRVCPHERLCEGECVVGFAIRPGGRDDPPVAIGRLETFVSDYYLRHRAAAPPRSAATSGFRVAVVGAGPAGLAVAEELAKLGHDCTIFDTWPQPGGLLRYGIPRFKLSERVLDEKLADLRRLPIQFVGDTYVGHAGDMTVGKLFAAGFDAVFLGTGAGVSGRLAIPGEEYAGIFTATDFLVRANVPPDELPQHLRAPLDIGSEVVVIGGGDTSIDCLRTAVRLGARKVTCVYRRTAAEMRARAEERQQAQQEGAAFQYLTMPLRFVGDDRGHVRGIECQRTALGDLDETGRRSPIPVRGSEFVMPADTVVIAIGYAGDPAISDTPDDLAMNERSLIQVQPDTYVTNHIGVFAGGDDVHGADLVVTALADARRAAAAIDRYLATRERSS
jgi:glutamate synthase (NADPH) small chain